LIGAVPPGAHIPRRAKNLAGKGLVSQRLARRTARERPDNVEDSQFVEEKHALCVLFLHAAQRFHAKGSLRIRYWRHARHQRFARAPGVGL
jgi:hypothetical protein